MRIYAVTHRAESVGAPNIALQWLKHRRGGDEWPMIIVPDEDRRRELIAQLPSVYARNVQTVRYLLEGHHCGITNLTVCFDQLERYLPDLLCSRYALSSDEIAMTVVGFAGGSRVLAVRRLQNLETLSVRRRL